MKYTVSIDIELPIDRVIELFDNPENLVHWMEGLQSFEHISGTPGQPGAKSKLLFIIRNKEMEMIETITERNGPYEFAGYYEGKGFQNNIRARFESLGSDKTRYYNEQEFVFAGFFMKIMTKLMPGMFKKQSMKYMTAFKKFAEGQAN
jgi:uncharacterized membrane protein